MAILEIPNFADMTIESKDPYKRDRDQWPIFRNKSARALLKHVDNFVRFVGHEGLPAVLCFYFHLWEFVEMPDSFSFGEGTVVPDPFLLKNCGDYALEQLEIVMGELQERSARFFTARGMAELGKFAR